MAQILEEDIIFIDKGNTQYKDKVQEARRVMEVCNACRYCEGFCAVFPAMQQRREFSDEDLDYLSNLCHNCTGCYHACQYTAPHPFNLNVPKALGDLRNETYKKYAWPGKLSGLIAHNGLFVSMLTLVSVSLAILIAIAIQSPEILFGEHQGDFYAIMPHNAMVALMGGAMLFVIAALVMSFVGFWRKTGYSLKQFFSRDNLIPALKDALTLRHLGGNGEGCNTRNESFSNTRRVFHHFMMYGFLLCFAATSVATVYDYGFGWPAPYPYFSLPVVLGTVGGIGLIIGPAGLLWTKINFAEQPSVRSMFGMDVAFLVLLMLVSITGLLLLAVRDTSLMGMTLAIHLGTVFTLFVAMPFSKFVHIIYRFAALNRNAIEAKAK
ncbi:tricarballylate utilization 4Fe-4S protein TcuB [Photobacterium rosenbergii]|uniref:tricarballylate utilization 4Fe-4S protein TcuB n=1 Tax=Photobacterium rosenbergii TaxID=294936 RepID=UPI001C996943|nr:tricarballylate utilization 4Fe-4S protein TcuB [Photobacterium rosenbergii]MBY5944641.1 tricarballylate utilization 4Fe-4S protein TcuB [Photobacterium rosenbergii]